MALHNDFKITTSRTWPLVALAINDSVDLDMLPFWISSGVDLLELRVDQYTEKNLGAVQTHVIDCAQLAPCLLTLRAAWEGGQWHLSEDERLVWYLTLMENMVAIDVELSTDHTIRNEIINTAHKKNKQVILSYHNFETTPEPETMHQKAKDAWDAGADVFKIAATCNDYTDLHKLAKLTLDYADQNIVVIGMGKIATISRICFPALGSKITYTFLGQPTAPGQLNCEATLEYLSTFYPDRIKFIKKDNEMAC